MAQKGIVWMLVAIAVIFMVEILIFSLFFTRVATFSREVKDSNVIFEGDEIETYVIAIEDSMQLSVAQSLYDFYLAHYGEVWQDHEKNKIPDIENEVEDSTIKYVGKFLAAYREFSGVTDVPAITFSDFDGGSLIIDSQKISVNFGEEKIEKTFFDAGTNYERKFFAESIFVTRFGRITERIDRLIGNDEIGNQTKRAIGFETYKPDKESEEPDSYLNGNGIISWTDDSMAKESEFSWLSDEEQKTQGSIKYCSKNDRETFSSQDTMPGTPWNPNEENVYEKTHGRNYNDAKNLIKNKILEHLNYYELQLDKETNEFTVDFTILGDPLVEIDGSCKEEDLGEACGNCNCAGSDEDGCYKWTCNVFKKKTCEFDHNAEVRLNIRFQEDGFKYGFWDSAQNEFVESSIKLVFSVISGNAKLGLS